MLRIRKVLLGVVLVVGLGPLGASLAYGLYLHSAVYRRTLEASLTDYLQLRIEIGRCSPLGLGSLSLQDVRASPPDGGGPIFHCSRAVWRENREGGSERRALDLHDGKLTLGSMAQAWRSPDYRRVLESVLERDFSEVNLDLVRLVKMDVDIAHPQWSMQVADSSGWVVPARGEVPARAVFEAHVLSGFAENLNLGEITGAWCDRSIAGRVEHVAVEAAAGGLGRVEFSGRFADVQLADLAAAYGLPPIQGCVNLDVGKGVLANGEVLELRAAGSVVEADLQTLTELLGLGRMTGSLGAEIRRLAIVDGRIEAAELDLAVRPPSDGPATIDRQMVIEAARNIFDAELPNLPFEELECASAAAKILIEGRRLRVLSLDDEGVRPILSVLMLGRELPLLRAPDRTFDVEDLLAGIAERIARRPQLPEGDSTELGQAAPRPL